MSVFKWVEEIKGELTKKQEQALATMKKIMEACDEKLMNMKELKRATKLSASALSKHLRELIRQGVIKGNVVVNKANRMENVFTYNPSAILKMKGKKPQPAEEVFRYALPKDREERRLFVQHGYIRRVKNRTPYPSKKRNKKPFISEYERRENKRFVPDSEWVEK